jgi:hypothetical protein
MACSVVIAFAMVNPGLCKNTEPARQACPQKDASSIMPAVGGVRVPFVVNDGQLGDNGVLFYARTFGGTVFVSADGDIGYSLASTQSKPGDPTAPSMRKTHVLRERFLNANSTCPDGEIRSPTRVSFFYGSDPSRWVRGKPAWETIAMGEIYDGIELRLRAYGNNVEKIFTLAPDADPDQIAVRILGADKLRVGKDGKLIAATAGGDVGYSAPVAWQENGGERVPVTVAYRVSGTAYGFELGAYDHNLPVTIDPMLASTYLGGSATENCRAIALDTSGNVYVTGLTESTNFPTTAGAYSTSSYPSWQYGDVFVSKLDGTLSTLLASAYFGGTKEDIAYSVALDGSGNVLLTGATESHNFPCTAGAYSTNYLGAPNSPNGNDAFVSKLSSDLSSLLASSYLAGYGSDYGYAVCADGAGNIYVTGYTSATNFPTTPGVYQPLPAFSAQGSADAFVSKFNGELSQLQASTYIGGSSGDEGEDCILDNSGNIYVTGITSSSNFPTTSGAYCRTLNAAQYQCDSFVFIMNNSLTELTASTYIGGSDDDYLYGIGRDAEGNVFVAGWTESSDYPTTAGAYQTNRSAYADTVVSKFNSNLSTLLASTYLGAAGFDWGRDLALDSSGNAYVCGTTDSSFFPTTSGEPNLRSTSNDFFVSKFNTDLTTLKSSARFGGVNVDWCYAVAVNSTGLVYVAGHSNSTNYPVTNGPYASSLKGSYDAVITKLYMADHVPSPIDYTPVAADFDGDGLADPVAVSNGYWSVWLSSRNYTLLPTSVGFFSDSTHLGADFDGDGLADPAAALTSLWFVYPSTLGYSIHEYTYGAASGTAVAADFDGDRKADPTRVHNGSWYVYYSGSGTEQGPYELGHGDGTPLAADFDGDRKADPAVVTSGGGWYVWLSSGGYYPIGPFQFGESSGTPLAADFDGDRKADPAWFICPNWYVWLSGSGYNLVGPVTLSIGSR